MVAFASPPLFPSCYTRFMAHKSPIDASMAMAMLGMQDSSGIAASAAFALALARRGAYITPTGAALARAQATATRFKLSEDLALFAPPAPGRFASRKRKDLFRSAVMGLKRIDQLVGDDRAQAIEQLRMLLGATGDSAS